MSASIFNALKHPAHQRFLMKSYINLSFTYLLTYLLGVFVIDRSIKTKKQSQKLYHEQYYLIGKTVRCCGSFLPISGLGLY